MDIFKQYATDPKLEQEGRWVTIGGTDEKPARILVARSGTVRYNAVMSQQYEANKTLMESKDTVAANAKLAEMVQFALANSVLLGWENIDYKGETGYSFKTAHLMLAHRDFREMVQKEADKFQEYKIKSVEEDSKN